MGGISFSGITQLFTAGTQPPHLAAIAPMSVTDDLYPGTGYPGGIFNSGFAQVLDHGADGRRQAGARGRPALGAGARQGGRQALHRQPEAAPADPGRAQAPEAEPVPHAVAVRAARARARGSSTTSVPTFLVGQFQDEQTSGHFAESLKYLNGKAERVDHAPERRARRLARPEHDHPLGRVPEAVRGRRDPGRPGLGARRSAARSTTSSPTRRRRPCCSRASRASRASPPPRRSSGATRTCGVLMDNGAGPQGPGSIGATWELDFSSWPPKEAQAPTRYYLGPSGALGAKPAKRSHRRLHGRPEGPARARRCPATARRTPGRRSRPTTGRRSRPARASASSSRGAARRTS